MNPALRVLGAVAVLLGIAGATYGAFATMDTDAQFASIGISEPDEPVTILAGGTTSVPLNVENLGEATEEVTLSTSTTGFTYDTQPATLDPGQTDTLAGDLGADTSLEGEETVHVHAQREGTQQRLGLVSFPVTIIEPQTVNLTLSADLPAATPGGEITLTGEATNPMDTEQEVTFTLTGADGTVDPETTTVPAQGATTVSATATAPDDPGGTLTVTLTAENQAGQTVTADTQVPILDEGDIAAGPVFDEVTIAPESEYALPVLVVSDLPEPAPVTAEGEHVVRSEFGTVQPGEALGGFATLQTPADQTDAYEADVTLDIGDEQRSFTVLVDPVPSGDDAEDGMQVTVDYVGRLADGSVFDSSLPEVAYGPFPQSDQFQERPGLEPLQIPLNAQQPGVVQGFYEALVSMAEGESKTATLSPTEAYGPPRSHENITATTELDRQNPVPRFIDDFPIQQLPPEFEIENKEEGDILTLTQDQGEETLTFRFELTRKGEQSVDLERLADVGETTTFYPMWPGATEVIDITDEEIIYQTTPPEDAGAFTWDADPQSAHAQWDNATRIEQVTDDQIVLRHTPEEGSTYTLQNPQQGPQEYLVEDVGEEEIHVSTPNGHPLAGLTLTFDITMHAVEEVERPGGPTIGGGGAP